MQLTIFDGPPGSFAEEAMTQCRQIMPAVHIREHRRPVRATPAQRRFWALGAIRPQPYDHAWLFGSWLGDPLTTHHVRVLERLALSQQVVRIAVLPTWAEVESGWARQFHTELNPLQRLNLKLCYDAHLAAASAPTRLPTVVYGGPYHAPPEALWSMVESMRLPSNIGPGVGAWRPGRSVLLVGERPNLRRGQTYLGPFCAWSNVGCSSWLSHRLEAARIPERDLYWINAYDRRGHAADPRFLNHLQPRLVVALGSVAARWCRRHDVRHVSVPHPQYWKRFRSRQPYPLLEALKPEVSA